MKPALWMACLVIASFLVMSLCASCSAPRAVLTFSMLGKYGRLGNQLFQIASVHGMSKSLGMRARFPSLPELDDAFELAGIDCIPSQRIKHDRIFHVSDPTALEMPRPPRHGVIDCRGYFQHQEYFRHVASDIRAAFRLRDHMVRRVAPLITPYTVGIHVRRGDYKDVLPASYYRHAALQLVSTTHPHVLVCSDDIAWCRENLRLDPRWNVTWSPWTRAIDDFAALVQCPALVMSNSTFSWWAAWLGDHPRGVIMPWPWFGSAEAWDDDAAPLWNRKDALVNPSWTVWTVPR